MQRRQGAGERNRERERRARKNRKYGQAKLKHAKRGIVSTGIAVAVGLLLILLLALAYTSGGKIGTYSGGLGLISMNFAGIGVYAGFRGFREREKNYLTCKIGIGCNIFYLIGFVAIFCRGLF